MSASIASPHFLLRRLHSLFGILPVGAFLAFHLWENSQSRFGAEHFNREVVGALAGLNYLPFIEIGLIALPLLLHALYGLVIIGGGRAEPLRYSYLRNRLYWLQRISGIGLLVFILLHVGMTRMAGLVDPAIHADLFGHMRAALANPWVFGFYLVGLWLAVVHFANGLATAAISWGLTTSAMAQRRFGWLCAAGGLLLGAIGTHGLVGYLTAPVGGGA
ncbi:MAG: succinate dehydrogenase [Thiohalocapsa sp.]|jgi:succinate dehydrogenase / fumarate reductase cytochrome b subunit|uniref:succinate dehydrogenase n=1 Tax=Thiohalocapsa sp. TaxID=2497641 RepID=UPI0025F36777|nr:succinate dehydrogenase [Thiohalocapsa sp.]MCG6941107.1 succinate dehydrogenase [Thiohalocapsa sp.]